MEHLQTIQQIFTARFLAVPDYQRGYAWEKKHWDDLLEDLELFEVSAEHYTGTLVLHASDHLRITDEEGREHGCYDIVDGQQRLTTIVILLDSIRRELPSKLQQLAEGIKKTYVLTRDIHGNQRPKLRLNRDTHQYFERNILADTPGIEGPQIRSQQLLRDAQTHMQEYVRKEKQHHGDDGGWLLNLHRKLTNGLKLTVYEVPKASDVGVIFEVMNNRGKPLSEMEKVKNYLLYLVSKVPTGCSEELDKKVNETWCGVFEGLMACEASSSRYEDQLLRAHWLTVYDHRPKTWAGNNSVKQRFSLKGYQGSPNKLVDDLNGYVDSLREFAIAYCDLIAPTRSDAFTEYRGKGQAQHSIQRAAEKLARLDALATFIPILGAVRLKHPRDADLLVSFLTLCEKYAFRVYRLAGRRSNAGQTSLFKIGYDLYHRLTKPQEALARIASYLLYYAPEDEFQKELNDSDDWYNWYGLKYFLYEYEEHLASGKTVQMPWDKLARADKKNTIEHILPQTPDDPYWIQRWSDEDIRLHLHDIGNLVLTFDNSSYGNKAFPQKRGISGEGTCYADSNMFMERQLARYQDWTKAECLQRRQEIVEWAARRWSMPVPAEAVEAPDLIDEDESSD